MSVDLLLCEGSKGSPDIIVLSAILKGTCSLKPSGGKYGLGERVLARREHGAVCSGILDRDFDGDNSNPLMHPRTWTGKDTAGKMINFGWRWERKEIENYLIDPNVVQKTLGSGAPNPSSYQAILDEAAHQIAIYSAARTALALSRVRFSPLPDSWGKARGKDSHSFPDLFDRAACHVGIEDVVKNHTDKHSLEPKKVQQTFDDIVFEFESSGIRLQNYLTFFAGKDLLCSMDANLVKLGFQSAGDFKVRILAKIEESSEDVWTWLPEWQALRDAIVS